MSEGLGRIERWLLWIIGTAPPKLWIN